MVDLDNKSFRLVSENDTGDVDLETVFEYQQQDKYIWGRYSGGSLRAGVLFGTMDEVGNLDFIYSHFDNQDRLKKGHCLSTLEKLPTCLLRYHEKWTWTGDQVGIGENIIEEILQNG